ncbi:MAG: class I SAM-dependent methyltransferase [Methylibium sp.]|uniref:methyltransferase domain-containing protein n=1 Tax=Methylibium sp. TaxID=2067992 RepID=UPI0017F0F159|nr:methyltransferase domain-containing protein [Methylibium sp.]MBA3597203.1 class I SAM-dependent methyltransferase [Methylibium sp.]
MHPYDHFWDLRLGISTFGYHPAVGMADHPNFRVHYTPVPYNILFRILRHIGLGANDVFVDLGCGLGRTVFSAAWLGVKRAIGVEIEASLVEQADRNRVKDRWRDRNVEFVCQSAESYAHAETTVIFMFHPFGEGTMTSVIGGLDQTLAQKPRRLRIAYLNPVHSRVLDASEQLVRIDHWPARRHSLSRNSRYDVGFWAAGGNADPAGVSHFSAAIQTTGH